MGSPWDPVRPDGAHWDTMGRNGIQWGPPETSWGGHDPHRIPLDPKEPKGILWGHHGTPWGGMGPRGATWDHMGPHGTRVCSLIVSHPLPIPKGCHRDARDSILPKRVFAYSGLAKQAYLHYP